METVISNKMTIECNIPRGYYISWIISTQTSYEVSILFQDDRQTYVNEKRQKTCFLPAIVGHQQVEGDNLKLTIDIPVSKGLKLAKVENELVAEGTGSIVGYVRCYAIEDYIDDDYNDVTVSIMAQKGKG